MEVNIPYEEGKDRTFYKSPIDQVINVDIGKGVFAVMFPNDGHGPQHYTEKPELIRKVTVKLPVADF